MFNLQLDWTCCFSIIAITMIQKKNELSLNVGNKIKFSLQVMNLKCIYHQPNVKRRRKKYFNMNEWTSTSITNITDRKVSIWDLEFCYEKGYFYDSMYELEMKWNAYQKSFTFHVSFELRTCVYMCVFNNHSSIGNWKYSQQVQKKN